MTLIFMLIIALVPSLFWLLLLLRKDYREPEPIGLLFRIFARGVIFAIPLTWFLRAATDQYFSTSPTNSGEYLWLSLVTMLLVVAPIEEYVKYWTAKKVVNKPKNEKQFSQVIDGIIYMAVAASAFAFVENLGYFYDAKLYAESLGFSPVLSWYGVMTNFGVRSVATTLMHLVSSGVLGYFWGRSRFENRAAGGNHLYFGFGIAVLIHGFFNFAIRAQATTNYELGLFPLVIAVAGLVFLYSRFSREQDLEIHEDSDSKTLLRADGVRPSGVISVVLVILVLSAGYIAFRGAVKEFAGDRLYYYSSFTSDIGLVFVTQASSLEQCNTLNLIYFEGMGRTTIPNECTGTVEANQILGPIFRNEQTNFPYIAFTDSRGNQVRTFASGNEDVPTQIYALGVLAEGMRTSTFPDAVLILPH